MRLKLASLPILLSAVLLGWSWTPAAFASDLAKEARWAEQIVDALLDGEAVWLEDGSGHEFLGIYTEADTSSKHVVILAHGLGVHPNWPDVIYPLRAGLLEHGVSTLSIQMPILENGVEDVEYAALYPEVPSRFDSALAYLAQQGYDKATIIAHSLGATMATYYLERNNPSTVESLVIIGMGQAQSYPGNINALAKIDLPILDLYGSADLPFVLDTQEQRARSAADLPGRDYLQIRVDGANHFFQGHEAELLREVTHWLGARGAT